MTNKVLITICLLMLAGLSFGQKEVAKELMGTYKSESLVLTIDNVGENIISGVGVFKDKKIKFQGVCQDAGTETSGLDSYKALLQFQMLSESGDYYIPSQSHLILHIEAYYGEDDYGYTDEIDGVYIVCKQVEWEPLSDGEGNFELSKLK